MESAVGIISARAQQLLNGKLNLYPHMLFCHVSAVGCTNLIPPEDAWIKREDDKIIIGCYTSRQTWQLRCHDGRWTGVVSNCSQGTTSWIVMTVCYISGLMLGISLLIPRFWICSRFNVLYYNNFYCCFFDYFSKVQGVTNECINVNSESVRML